MKSFVERLSNVLAWGGFIYAVLLGGYAPLLLVNKSFTVQPDRVYELCMSTEFKRSEKKRFNSREDELQAINQELAAMKKCMDKESAFDLDIFLKLLFQAALLYIPYVIIVIINYLMMGRFRLLPWQKLKDSQDT